MAYFFDIISVMKYIYINLIYLLMALCIVFDIGYIVCKSKKKNIIGLFCKTLAALSFILIGYLGYSYSESTFSKYILMGLLFDGLGDLFLAFRNLFAKKVMFVLGAISFLGGHILFVRALFLFTNSYYIECIMFSVIIGSFLFYLFDRACHFNKGLTVLGISYLVIISMMVCLSVGVYFTNKTIKNLVFMIGATLFIASDIILIVYNFSKKEKWMHPIYSLLYFSAQILISYSLFL